MEEDKGAGIRGWVYVITNTAMPDLVKVGYSLKDPALRARKLNHTGSPHPYSVEYDVLVRDPRLVEQQVHASLTAKLEGKEWFRCSVADAIQAIRLVTGANALLQMVCTTRPDSTDASTVTKPSHSVSSTPGATSALRRIGTYAGRCNYCGLDFSVTLTRSDSSARCPHCLRMNDTTEFQRKEFLI
jgi:hypothetical protein